MEVGGQRSEVRRKLFSVLCLPFSVLFFGALWLTAQDAPPIPQQPLVIRHTNLVTNVVISITTTIQEVQGIKVDNRFIPLRTNLMFRTATNVWSTP